MESETQNVESEAVFWSVSRWVAEDWDRKGELDGPILGPKAIYQVSLGRSCCPLDISFFPSQMKALQQLTLAFLSTPDLRWYRGEEKFLQVSEQDSSAYLLGVRRLSI